MQYQVEYLTKLANRDNVVAVFDNYDDAEEYAVNRAIFCGPRDTLIVKEIKKEA